MIRMRSSLLSIREPVNDKGSNARRLFRGEKGAVSPCFRKLEPQFTQINKILIEEMPAYFLGQKDLDSVVAIIQDRAQTVLDAR